MIEGTLLPRSFGLKSLAFAGSTRLKDRLFALLHLKSCLLYRRIEENRDHVIHLRMLNGPNLKKSKEKIGNLPPRQIPESLRLSTRR